MNLNFSWSVFYFAPDCAFCYFSINESVCWTSIYEWVSIEASNLEVTLEQLFTQQSEEKYCPNMLLFI